jgi:hypothetical protein
MTKSYHPQVLSWTCTIQVRSVACSFTPHSPTRIAASTCSTHPPLQFAIRENIQKDIERERERAEMDTPMDDAEEEDFVPCITREHFIEAMKYARRSVSDRDIAKYEMFAPPVQHCRLFGTVFK